MLRWLSRPLNLALAVFIWTLLMGMLVQFLLLPFVFPAWHAGFGLIRGVDGLKFHGIALQLAQAIMTGGWSEWRLLPRGQLVSGIAAIWYVMIYPAPWSLLPFNALLNSAACVGVYLMLRRLMHDDSRSLIAVLPFILFPSNLLWNAQLHNENYAVPGVIFLLFGWTLAIGGEPVDRLVRAPRVVGAVICIVLGSLLLGLVRLYILTGMLILFGIGAIGLSLIRLCHRLGARLYLPSLAVLIVAWVAMLLVARIVPVIEGIYATARAPTEDAQASSDTGSQSDAIPGWRSTPGLPRILDEQFREIALARYALLRDLGQGGTNIDADVSFESAGQVLAYAPRALQIGFLSPFPDLWFSRSDRPAGSAMRAISALETSIVYMSLTGLPIFLWRYRRQPALWMMLFVCAGMLVSYAMAVPNVGALYRFRYPFLMPLVSLGVAGWLTRIRIVLPSAADGVRA